MNDSSRQAALPVELRAIHRAIHRDIERQLAHFKTVWREGSDDDIFCELVFCLFTPQSSAYRCWDAVQRLKSNNLIFRGCSDEISGHINTVRFRNNKARYLVRAREFFTVDGSMRIKSILSSIADPVERRRFLVENVRGMSWKEASHFLRNTGFGEDLAILDRHVLKNLAALGVIPRIPPSLTAKRYLEIEAAMRAFTRKVRIPLAHLDFVLWYREAGSVFK